MAIRNSSKMDALRERIAAYAHELGFDVVGIASVNPVERVAAYEMWLAAGHHGEMGYLARTAEKRRQPDLVLPGWRSIITLGWNYHVGDLPAEVQRDPSRGLIARYAWGVDYHEVLAPLLADLADFVRRESGGQTQVRPYVDTGPLLERAWAEQAGTGFIGKNTYLINTRLGSWLFLAELLVDVALGDEGRRTKDGEQRIVDQVSRIEFSNDDPLFSVLRPSSSRGTCGHCTRCLDVCPTKAFKAPYQLDARLCIAYLTIELKESIPRELRPLIGNWIFGCDLCGQVCPWNRRFAKPRWNMPLEQRLALGAPRLTELAALAPEQFKTRFGKTPILRTKRRGLLRNVCVALGNWGSDEAEPALHHLLTDAEPLVREHAAWGLGRIGTPSARMALEKRLVVETESAVQGEIRWTLDGRKQDQG